MVLLATVILILYEACWIVRLGHRLTRVTAMAEPAGREGEGVPDEGGGV